MKANVLLMTVALAATGAVAAIPTVSNVSLVQDDETRLVTVSYDLDVEAIVVAEILTNGVAIGWSEQGQLAGAVNRQTPAGEGKQIWWRPDRTWSDGGKIVSGTVTARVTAYPVDNPPDYMVADLTGTTMKFYYPCVEALPHDINDRLYKTEMMVFRKIPAAGATFRSGIQWWGETGYTEGYNHPHRVTLTNDFYLGVFPVTQAQTKLAEALKSMSTTHWAFDPSYTGEDADLCPMDNLSGDNVGFGYPTRKGIDDYSLEVVTLLSAFRTILGTDYVITPTIAEWEFACQAGSEEAIYGGYTADEVAWCAANSDGHVHPVGLKKPNAFGLYDMLGNVFERTRESGTSVTYKTDVTAPFATSGSYGSYLMMMGGAFDSERVHFEVREPGSNSSHHQDTKKPGWGVRLYLPLK